LVVGDDPSSTTILPSRSGRSLVIANWDYGRDFASVVSSISAGRFEEVPTAEVSLCWHALPQRLFDSAAPGDEVDRSLRAELPPGEYDVCTLRYRPADDISLVLHWLRSASRFT
jgi:hypothetical protein